MKQLTSKLSILFLSSLVFCSASFAATPNTTNPQTFLGPTARLGFTTTLSDTSAIAVAGEAAPKNYRLNLTMGWELDPEQRIKLTGEYLWQDINYAFFSGDADAWVQQLALGLAYQHDFFAYRFSPQLDVSGYFSHASSRTLGTVQGQFVNAGVPFVFLDPRRIAGSNAFGITPGVSASFWAQGRIGLDINYDNVFYSQQNTTPNHDAQGLGATIFLKQNLTNNLDLDLAAGMRQPYNDYSFILNWSHVPFHGDWTLGFFGDYITGKNTLPSTWDIGLNANYLLDRRTVATPINYKNEQPLPHSDNLLAWTADPAVYMPQVLAVSDAKTNVFCPEGIVSFTTQILNLASNSGSFNILNNFTGTNLRFSVSTTPSLATGDFIEISNSGQLTYFFSNNPPYRVIVTAQNACNAANSNVFSLGAG